MWLVFLKALHRSCSTAATRLLAVRVSLMVGVKASLCKGECVEQEVSGATRASSSMLDKTVSTWQGQKDDSGGCKNVLLVVSGMRNGKIRCLPYETVPVLGVGGVVRLFEAFAARLWRRSLLSFSLGLKI